MKIGTVQYVKPTGDPENAYPTVVPKLWSPSFDSIISSQKCKECHLLLLVRYVGLPLF
jgi:hypothetical protein